VNGSRKGVGHDLSASICEDTVCEEMRMWRKIDFQARGVGRQNTRLRRGRHAHIKRRDATGALITLLFFVTAQIAHDGVEKIRKEGEMSGAAVLAPGARRLKYDKRGKDNRVNVHAQHYISATRSIYPALFWPS